MEKGIQIGALEVVRKLGSGSYGDVLEVREPRSGERFALKRLRPGVLNALDIERFRREASVMKRLNHPNLMPVVHVDVRATPPYYLMPLCKGVTLDARLRRGTLTALEVVKVARDAAFGLSEAARSGIVHRDVKPSNLFLEDSGRTRVLDFGLAKTLADGLLAVTQRGTLVGTPAYMAPEQCRGEAVTDRTDVYSLGVTIIELVLGRNPFLGPDVISTLARHLDATPRRLDALVPHRVSPEMGEIVDRMIAKAPLHRPAMDRCLETFAGVCAALERSPKLKTRRLTGPPPAA